jgi:hypothetical protein
MSTYSEPDILWCAEDSKWDVVQPKRALFGNHNGERDSDHDEGYGPSYLGALCEVSS